MKWLFNPWFLLVVWGVGLFPIYYLNKDKTDTVIVEVMAERAKILRQHLDIAFAHVTGLKQQMETNIVLAENGMLSHPALMKLQNFEALGGYGLRGHEVIEGTPLTANLTGVGSVKSLSSQVRQEIGAALALNLYSAIQENKYDFVWSYYTSKEKFIFLSPRVTIDDYRFVEEDYGKPFWWIALPANNPSADIVISPIYEDGAGQGKMISISNPVYVNGIFRGVVSLDIGLRQLRDALIEGQEYVVGDALLFSAQGELIAANQPFDIGTKLPQAEAMISHLGEFFVKDRMTYFTLPVVSGQMFITIQISTPQMSSFVIYEMFNDAVLYGLVLLTLSLLIKLIRSLSEVRLLASQDSLTKLLNRRAIEMRAQQTLGLGLRSHQKTSILMLDIDFFKRINDKYGHQAGDSALVYLAKTLKTNLRSTDIVGRFGGEEFLIVLPDTNQAGAAELAEKLRNKIADGAFHNGRLQLTVSIGCAECCHESESFDSILGRTDAALYKAKELGRNRVEMAICYESYQAEKQITETTAEK